MLLRKILRQISFIKYLSLTSFYSLLTNYKMSYRNEFGDYLSVKNFNKLYCNVRDIIQSNSGYNQLINKITKGLPKHMVPKKFIRK